VLAEVHGGDVAAGVAATTDNDKDGNASADDMEAQGQIQAGYNLAQ
jgi:hypothetical protein